MSDEAFSRVAGELGTGEDFWKNDIIDFCLVAEEAAAAGRVAFAGVRAALAALSPGIAARAQMAAHDGVETGSDEISRRMADCWIIGAGQSVGYNEWATIETDAQSQAAIGKSRR